MRRLTALLAAAAVLLVVAVTLDQRRRAPEPPIALPATGVPGASGAGAAAESVGSPSPPAPPIEEPAPAAPPPVAEPLVPLDRILDWRDERPAPDLFGSRVAPGDDASGRPAGALSKAADSVRVEQKVEEVGPKGPNQRSLEQTDLGVALPVGKSVSVKGGARVEQGVDDEAATTPTAGVEVKF